MTDINVRSKTHGLVKEVNFLLLALLEKAKKAH